MRVGDYRVRFTEEHPNTLRIHVTPIAAKPRIDTETHIPPRSRVSSGGLSPASSATSLRAQPDGKVFITDRPYLETKEHIGGFWVLEAASRRLKYALDDESVSTIQVDTPVYRLS